MIPLDIVMSQEEINEVVGGTKCDTEYGASEDAWWGVHGEYGEEYIEDFEDEDMKEIICKC